MLPALSKVQEAFNNSEPFFSHIHGQVDSFLERVRIEYHHCYSYCS